MKRLLLGFLFVLATFAFFAGPSLRTAYATITGRQVDITLPPGDLHPAKQALNFLLKPPVAQGYGKEMKLWATYYHMPTVYSAKVDPKTAKPLLGRNGKAISPPLNLVDWCDAAMQGSIWVDDGGDEPTAYMYVDSNGPEQNVCDKYFGELSNGIKTATKRARFVAFHHPQACDVRSIPLMAFRTIAVDPAKIKMGTVLYIPELRGLGFWKHGELFAHDGYVVASDRGGAIEGNHIDMFVDNAEGNPFPDVVHSSSRGTFKAYVVDKLDPAYIALTAAHEEVCKDSDRPGRKKRKPAAPVTPVAAPEIATASPSSI
jgi:3D (Asp-Asp-Asp) domain-containing protein